MTKKCTKCKLEKDLNEFYNAKSFKDGKTYECKQCMTFYRVKNKERNIAYQKRIHKENPEKFRENDRKYWRDLNPSQKLLQQGRNRSKRKNIPFNLEKEDIVIPTKCPLLECAFVIGKKYAYPYTHSLDRIDNEKGYIKGNVQVICMKANSMKNSATKKELLTFAKNVILQYKDDDIVQNLIKQLSN